MTKISDALTYGLTIRESANDGSDFTNPTTDYRRLFLGEDGMLHVKDSAGAVTSPYAGAGEITDIATTEDDTDLRLAPDGVGGVEWAAGGGGGFVWTSDDDNPLTATTGLSTDRGTWSIDGTLKEAGTDGNHNRALDDSAIVNGAAFIVEAEVKIPTTFSYIGIFVNRTAAGGGYVFRIDTANTIRMELDGSTNIGTVAYVVPAAGTWVKLRLVVFGQSAFGYVDGALLYTAGRFAFSGQSLPLFPGISCWASTACYFRNLKAWSIHPADMSLPA